MVNPIILFLGAIAVAEIYRRYTTDDEKQDWENKVQIHHGEIGALAAILGVLTGHYGAAATGLGLALHDVDDAQKWFTSDKQNPYNL